MSLERADFLERAEILAKISSEFEFQISKPATEKAVSWRQSQVSRPIPRGISEFATRTASRIRLRWEVDFDNFPEFDLVEEPWNCGYFEFNFFRTDLSLLDGWEDSFENWKDYRSDPNPFRYEEIFPIFDIGNGDLIVAMIGGSDEGSIYYLDHEGADGDWKRLGDSYDQFVTTLALLWFPELDWYHSLKRFHDKERGIISAENALAREVDLFIRNCAGSR